MSQLKDDQTILKKNQDELNSSNRIEMTQVYSKSAQKTKNIYQKFLNEVKILKNDYIRRIQTKSRLFKITQDNSSELKCIQIIMTKKVFRIIKINSKWTHKTQDYPDEKNALKPFILLTIIFSAPNY